MEIRVVVQEAGNKYTSGSSYTTLGYRPKECVIFPQRHFLTHVYCCCIHDSQKLETSRCSSIEDHIKKMWDIYTMNITQLIKKRKWNSRVNGWR